MGEDPCHPLGGGGKERPGVVWYALCCISIVVGTALAVLMSCVLFRLAGCDSIGCDDGFGQWCGEPGWPSDPSAADGVSAEVGRLGRRVDGLEGRVSRLEEAVGAAIRDED